MLLPDVNVLVYALRPDVPGHGAYRKWLEALVNSPEAYGMADLVPAGFVRVVTNPRVFHQPEGPASALRFAERLRDQPHCVRISPGPRHWEIFRDLCEQANAARQSHASAPVAGAPRHRRLVAIL
jgi:toxin-antitoxin system PIN domain toxin